MPPMAPIAWRTTSPLCSASALRVADDDLRGLRALGASSATVRRHLVERGGGLLEAGRLLLGAGGQILRRR